MSCRSTCRDCHRLLDRRYGDGDVLCAGCRERNEESLELARALEPKPGAAWEPVRGRIGGVDFGQTRRES